MNIFSIMKKQDYSHYWQWISEESKVPRYPRNEFHNVIQFIHVNIKTLFTSRDILYFLWKNMTRFSSGKMLWRNYQMKFTCKVIAYISNFIKIQLYDKVYNARKKLLLLINWKLRTICLLVGCFFNSTYWNYEM